MGAPPGRASKLFPMDLLEGLNEPQRAAVAHQDGPLLIFAGAGSGKTRTLTHRIAYLIQSGTSPHRILAVTFTNKAAKEMRERLENLVGPVAKRMWLGTFHAMCAQMLRIHGERIGLNPRFTILDSDDQLRVMKECVKDANLDTDRFKPSVALGKVSDAKNLLLTPPMVAARAGKPHEKVYANLYARYQERLRATGSMDFDDLLMEAVRLLQESPETLEHWSERFKHVLIDEFQDVNEAQFQWARMLASKHRNICVVGDDDQSIYAWRGADVKIILDFEKRYPDATVVRLEQNYRSTQNILDAAYGVISQNAGRAPKRLWTEEKGGPQLTLHGALNAQEEAAWVVRQVEMLRRSEHLEFGDFAILCRVNAQSRPFEEAFLRARVPLKLVGTQRFYERREIRDVLAYLRWIYNPDDDGALKRLVNVPPRGIGAATVDKLDGMAREQGRSVGAVLLDNGTTGKALTPVVARKIEPLQRLLRQLMGDARSEKTLADLLDKILERTRMLDWLRGERDADSVDRAANVEELVRAAEAFDLRLAEEVNEEGEASEAWDDEGDPLRLGMFLGDVVLDGSGDKDNAHNQGDDAVTFMTLHAAKGLEFPVVFLAGVEQGLLPHSRAVFGENASDDQLEEERRLMYVGLTRAQKRAFLSYAQQRTMHGRTETTQQSQFLDEIPGHLMDKEGLAKTGNGGFYARSTAWGNGGRSGSRGRVEDLPRPIFASPTPASASREAASKAPTFRVGEKVRHKSYGEGLVVAAAAAGGAGEWVEVAFLSGGVGKKKLIVAFAGLEKVE